jgi:DNA invertase Pin-like site-specific DNA recombinase
MGMNDTKAKPRAAVYLRKSSVDDRAGENRSFARQTADMAQIISGCEVVAEFTEKIGTSASHLANQARPEWDRALAGLGYNYDVLIGAQVDRLDRQGIGGLVKILEACEQGHGKGRVVTSDWDSDSSEARIIGPILFELARAESMKLQARIKAGKQVQRDRHDFLGNRPAYCWDVVRDQAGKPHFKVIPERKQHVVEAAAMYLTGKSSASISKHFNQLGIRTKLGNKFQPDAWVKIFENPSMSSHRHYGGEIIKDENGVPIKFAEPILGPGVLTKVRAEIARRKKPSRKPYATARKALLVPLIRCQDCGEKLYKNTYRYKGKQEDQYLCKRCPNGSWRIAMDEVDELIGIEVMKMISDLEPGSKLALEIVDQVQSHFAPSDESRQSVIIAELEILNAKLATFRKQHLLGKIDAEEFEELEAIAEQAKKELVEEQELIPAPPTDLNAILDWGPGGPIGEGSLWASLTNMQKTDLIASVIGRIDVEPRWMEAGDSNRGSTTHQDVNERVHISWLHESNVKELKPRTPAAAKKAAKAS